MWITILSERALTAQSGTVSTKIKKGDYPGEKLSFLRSIHLSSEIPSDNLLIQAQNSGHAQNQGCRSGRNQSDGTLHA